MPSKASPYPTPSSMIRRSFWVNAMRVYLVVSGGSLASPSAISRARASSLSRRYDLVDGTPILCRLGIELLPGEDEVAPTHGADHFLPQQVNSIAGHDTEFEVRLILKNCRWGGQHDVGEEDIFGVQSHRAVDRSNQRHFDVQDVHEDLFALAINLVVALWSKEVEAFRADSVHERFATAGQDDHAIVRVRSDVVEQVDKLLMSVSIEDESSPISVKRHFQDAGLRTGQTSIGKAVAIGIKAADGFVPLAAGRAG